MKTQTPPRWRKRTLSLRMWLVLAVLAITGAGVLAQLTMTAIVTVWEQQAAAAQMATVRQILGTDATQWADPAWQRRATASLGSLGVDVALFASPSGQRVYVTPGARGFLDTNASDGGSTPPPSYNAGIAVSPQPAFERLVISSPSHSSAGNAASGTALLWFTGPQPGAPPGVLWFVVELGTFVLTLAIVVWLMGQPVLRPLAEMSQAADDMAGGDLDIQLTRSPVREIAEVSAALEGTSAALRESLARQDALEGERRMFVGAIAHDLRTPLFMLRGYLQGLERGVATTPERVAHYVEMCRIQADALERLIADLFAYTRLEYLDQAPAREPLDLGALLRQTVESAQPLADAKGISLDCDAAPAPLPLTGDSHLLARAVENLLDNAVRHTPAGGRITVRWSKRGNDTLTFSVEDSGPGIAANDLPHLFTPLYRGEASRNRQTGGAGLGLAIARRILRAHGGDLTAANRPSGGAVFTAVLPDVSESAQQIDGSPRQVTAG